MARKKKLTKAIRLESNWDTFQIEHPEVKVTKDCKGKILSFSLPENYYLVYLLFSDDKTEVTLLRYITPEDTYVKFPK